MASTGYQASDCSLLGQSATITANNIVSFSRQTAPVAAWSFRRWGQVSLITQLIRGGCKASFLIAMNWVLESQKNANIKLRENMREKFDSKTAGKSRQNPIILLQRNSQASEKIKNPSRKRFFITKLSIRFIKIKLKN